MRQTLFIAGLLLLGLTVGPGPAAAQSIPNPNYSPLPPKEAFRYPGCYCPDDLGQRVELGRMARLIVGTRRVLARCGMSVNNPTWREQSEGCPGV